MTEQEIKSAEFIGSVILPKLQEIQRDIYLDKHITMDIEQCTYKKCLNVYLTISAHSNGFAAELCGKEFQFLTFLCNTEIQRKENLKALRGIQYFVKNWQKRLA